MQLIYFVFLILILIYLFLYIKFVIPLHNLEPYQSKKWITKLNEDLLLGIKDERYFQQQVE